MMELTEVPAWLQGLECTGAAFICGHIGYRKPQLWRVFVSERSGRYRITCKNLGCRPTDKIGGPWNQEFEVSNGIRVHL